MVLTTSVVSAMGDYRIKNLEREILIEDDLTYSVQDSMTLLGLSKGVIELYLGDYVVDEVKIDDALIKEEEYAKGTLNLTIESGKIYKLKIKGHGILDKNEISSRIWDKNEINDIDVKIRFNFANFVITSTSPKPRVQTENEIEWRFTKSKSKTISASWVRIDNEAGFKARCNILLLAGEENRLNIFCDISAEEYRDRVKIDLPESLEFDSSNLEKISTKPLILKLGYPSKKFNLNMDLKTNSNKISIPKFECGTQVDINLALYSAENYRVENITTTFKEISKYDATFLRELKIPEGYKEVSFYRGGEIDTISFHKEKLMEKFIPTRITRAEYDIFPTKRGFGIVKSTYLVINTETGKYLILELPQDSKLWGVIINGKVEKAFGEGNEVKIPLPVSNKVGVSYEEIRVTIFYVMASDIFKGGIFSQYNLVLPKHDLPIVNLEARIGLPPGFSYLKSDVTPEMETNLVKFRPKGYVEPIRYDVVGFAKEEMAKNIEQLSMYHQAREVALPLSSQVMIQIPTVERYVQVRGYMLTEMEEVKISIHGFDEIIYYLVAAIIALLVILFVIAKREKIKEALW